MAPYAQHPEAARGQLQYIPRVSRCRVHLEPHSVSGPGGLAVVALRELWDPALRTGIRTVHRYSAWPAMPVFCDCKLPAIWAPRVSSPSKGSTSGSTSDPKPRGSLGAGPSPDQTAPRFGSRPPSPQLQAGACGAMGCGPGGGAWEWRCRNAGRAGAGCQARDGPSLLDEWNDEALSFGSLPASESSSEEGDDDSDDAGDVGETSSSDSDDDDF